MRDWFSGSALYIPLWMLAGTGMGLWGAHMSGMAEALWVLIGFAVAGLAWRASAQQVRVGREIQENLGKLVSVTEPSPVNVLAAAAAKILTLEHAQNEATSKLSNLQEEITLLKKDQQRTVSRAQWKAISQVLTALANKEQRLSLSIKVPYGDLEAEKYAKDFMRIFSCGIGSDNLIGPDLVGLIIRVRDRSLIPPTATYLSQALEAAGIEHRIDSLDLQFPLRTEFETELVVGSNG
jgi:hypothetical protein